jgi:uncharacterized membrane protein
MRLPILVLHISGGVLAMLAGAVAMSFRKGSRGHRIAGNVFVLSMIVMGAFAVPLALMKHDMPNFFGGMLAIYLASTAWLAARRNDSDMRSSVFEWGGFLFALTLGSLTLIHGWQKATGRVADDGAPTFMSFFLGFIILVAATGDIRVIFRGISGRRRIIRHLWRMCFGWFFASGSFFLGPNNRPLRLLATIGLRQQIFRTLLREEVLLFLAVLPLLLLIFWLVRVRFTSAYKRIKTTTRDSEKTFDMLRTDSAV